MKLTAMPGTMVQVEADPKDHESPVTVMVSRPGVYTSLWLTAEEARQLAAMLTVAADQASQKAVDLTAHPFTNATTLQGDVVHSPHRQETAA